MTPENFCYWLHGWFEIENPKQVDSNKLSEIKNHLVLGLQKYARPNEVFDIESPFYNLSGKYPLGESNITYC